MVKGLELFREHFKAFADRYVLIGGVACDLIMNEAGLPFRATKDLDIVLCLDAVDADFARAFWTFIRAGEYQVQETSRGERRFYRFQKPGNAAYPVMLELFSRAPEALPVAEGSHLTPVPISDEVSSLSAILLDTGYYTWIQAGRQEVDGLPIVGAAHLVPLKAKAWIDLRARKEAGEPVDSRSIQKHKNDVFRLFQVIAPDIILDPPPPILDDMRTFLDLVGIEGVNLKSLGLHNISMEVVLEGLRDLYSESRK